MEGRLGQTTQSSAECRVMSAEGECRVMSAECRGKRHSALGPRHSALGTRHSRYHPFVQFKPLSLLLLLSLATSCASGPSPQAGSSATQQPVSSDVSELSTLTIPVHTTLAPLLPQ